MLIRSALSGWLVGLTLLAGCDAVTPELPKDVNVGVTMTPLDANPIAPGRQAFALGSRLLQQLTVRNDGANTAFPPIVVVDTLSGFDPAMGDRVLRISAPPSVTWSVDSTAGVIRFTLNDPLEPGGRVVLQVEVEVGGGGERRRAFLARVDNLGGGQENDVCARSVDATLELLPEGVTCRRDTDPDAIDVWVSGDPGQDNGEDLYALALLLSDPKARLIGVDAVGWLRLLAGEASPQHCDPNPPRSSYDMYERTLGFFDFRAHVPLYSGEVCKVAEPALPRRSSQVELRSLPISEGALALAHEIAGRIRTEGPALHYVATGTVTNLTTALLLLRDDPEFGFSEAAIGRKVVVHMEGFDFTAPHLDVHLNMQTDPMAFRILFEWNRTLRLFVLPARPDQVGFEYKFLPEWVDDAPSPCAAAFFSYMLRRFDGTSGDYPCGDPTYISRTTTLQIGGGVLAYLVRKSHGGLVTDSTFVLEETTAPVYRPAAVDIYDNFLSPTGGRPITLYRVPQETMQRAIRIEALRLLLSTPCEALMICTSEGL